MITGYFSEWILDTFVNVYDTTTLATVFTWLLNLLRLLNLLWAIFFGKICCTRPIRVRLVCSLIRSWNRKMRREKIIRIFFSFFYLRFELQFRNSKYAFSRHFHFHGFPKWQIFVTEFSDSAQTFQTFSCTWAVCVFAFRFVCLRFNRKIVSGSNTRLKECFHLFSSGRSFIVEMGFCMRSLMRVSMCAVDCLWLFGARTFYLFFFFSLFILFFYKIYETKIQLWKQRTRVRRQMKFTTTTRKHTKMWEHKNSYENKYLYNCLLININQNMQSNGTFCQVAWRHRQPYSSTHKNIAYLNKDEWRKWKKRRWWRWERWALNMQTERKETLSWIHMKYFKPECAQRMGQR